MELIKLNFGNLFDKTQTLDVALGAHDLDARRSAFQAQVSNSKQSAYSGYQRQILAAEGLQESLKLADELRSKFDRLLVLGIGGSALGTRAIYESLKHKISRSSAKEIRIIDNLDPVFFQRECSGLDWKKTAVAVISKSGSTIETMAQFSWVLSRLKDAGISPQENVVAITDPSGGDLRRWVNEKKILNLSLAGDVGGRFSVFSPVGLFPLAFAGLDVRRLVEGAQLAFKEKAGYSTRELLQLATRLYDYEEAGLGVHTLFLYSTVMRECGAWFVQLWGESIGKLQSEKKKSVGSFPITAVGATDQHSILQLLMEGRKESVVGFLRIGKWNQAEILSFDPLPAEFGNALAFAYGRKFPEILNAESRATEAALMNSGRPAYSVELDQLDEACLGAWMAMMMDLTSMMGAVHQINPYDQPGVELGKKLLRSVLAN